MKVENIFVYFWVMLTQGYSIHSKTPTFIIKQMRGKLSNIILQ